MSYRRLRLRTIAALLTGSAAIACLTHPALAHNGPPYQVLAETAAGPYITSVWADPDVGAGTIYVMVQSPAGEASGDSTEPVGSRSAAAGSAGGSTAGGSAAPDSAAGASGSPIEVTVAARPADGHLPEAVYPARFDPAAGADAQRFVADIPFDAEGRWNLRIALAGAAGPGEIQTAVDVTPVDGPQLWEVGIYLLPFALLALVFVWARLRQRGEPAEPDAADQP